mmetsp:Transcript_8494/g.35986  ORF Transcript_8494/g.35986 Transcript_8494/m.35986 type:complete len:219 (-) Transcript_8494:546-1202(-)
MEHRRNGGLRSVHSILESLDDFEHLGGFAIGDFHADVDAVLHRLHQLHVRHLTVVVRVAHGREIPLLRCGHARHHRFQELTELIRVQVLILVAVKPVESLLQVNLFALEVRIQSIEKIFLLHEVNTAVKEPPDRFRPIRVGGGLIVHLHHGTVQQIRLALVREVFQDPFVAVCRNRGGGRHFTARGAHRVPELVALLGERGGSRAFLTQHVLQLVFHG